MPYSLKRLNLSHNKINSHQKVNISVIYIEDLDLSYNELNEFTLRSSYKGIII